MNCTLHRIGTIILSLKQRLPAFLLLLFYKPEYRLLKRNGKHHYTFILKARICTPIVLYTIAFINAIPKLLRQIHDEVSEDWKTWDDGCYYVPKAENESISIRDCYTTLSKIYNTHTMKKP